MAVVESPVREAPPSPAHAPAKPAAWGYGWAAIVVLVGLLASLQWSFALLRASEAEADTFGRGDVPGTQSVELHPGTWYVYEEAGATVDGVEVIGPDGASVAVDDVSKGFFDFSGYDRNGRGASAVGVFRVEPGAMGEYRITVTGHDEFGDGTFAVGEGDVVTFRRNQTVGMLVMLIVTVGTGLAIATRTFRSRRSST